MKDVDMKLKSDGNKDWKIDETFEILEYLPPSSQPYF